MFQAASCSFSTLSSSFSKVAVIKHDIKAQFRSYREVPAAAAASEATPVRGVGEPRLWPRGRSTSSSVAALSPHPSGLSLGLSS